MACLDAAKSTLSFEPVNMEAKVSYESKTGFTNFDITFNEDPEITGHLKLHLWGNQRAWSKEDIRMIKWEPQGMGEHFKHIMERHRYFEENQDSLKLQLDKYKAYKSYSRPPKAE